METYKTKRGPRASKRGDHRSIIAAKEGFQHLSQGRGHPKIRLKQRKGFETKAMFRSILQYKQCEYVSLFSMPCLYTTAVSHK